jgi:hypothetical protein
MADPDGISIMGYAGLPAATTGSALYVLAFEINSSTDSHPQPPTVVGTADVIAKTPLTTYSVWSLAGPASLVFPVEAGSCYRVVDMLGEARLGQSCAEAGGQLRVENVTDAPLIVAQLAKAT